MANKTQKTLTCRIDGMDCPDCAAKVEKVAGKLAGVSDLRVNFTAGKLSATIASPQAESALRETVTELGYSLNAPDQPQVPATNNALITLLITGALVALGLLLHFLPDSLPNPVPNPAPSPSPTSLLDMGDLWEKLVFGVAMLVGGWPIAKKGLAAARHAAIDMNVLMSVAVIGALFIDAWDEAAMVVFLFSLAQWLEGRSMDRARHAVRALMALAPPVARVLRVLPGSEVPQEVSVAVENVRIGEVFRLRPGDKVPLDGDVVSGHSALNQAPITGESLPVDKAPGDTVYAASINAQGSLDVRVTRLADDTTLAHIIHLIEEAQAARAPAQTFIDRFARIYTPAVIVLAALIAVLPPLLFGGIFSEWFYRALVLLVIACPCALVISTPVAIVSGLTRGARAGVLIKGGMHLENTGHLRAIAFDKTGTLTEGRPRVQTIEPLADAAGLTNISENTLLRIAASLEARSEHPLAQALLERAAQAGITPDAVMDFTALPGRGVQGRIDGHHYQLGNHRLFEDLGLCNPAVEAVLERREAEGKTVIMLGDDKQVLGLISIADQAREAAAGVIQQLRDLGIEHITLLTGDNRGTAQAIAAQLDIDNPQAELLPADKVAAMHALVARYGRVAMVGDGVNDAPAMAAASTGIAMGAAGSDTALETADVVLMGDDLTRLPFAIQLSRRTLRIIRQNIGVALGFKVIFLALAIPGYATLWMAVFADMGASLLVIANSLRLLRLRE